MVTIKTPRKVNILHLFSFICTILRKYKNNKVILFIDAQYIRGPLTNKFTIIKMHLTLSIRVIKDLFKVS